jgi:hypothetical protein
MISKDQSIVTQVAAKIASELTPKTDDVMANIASWVIAFEATTDALLEKHGMTDDPNAVTATIINTATQKIMEAFPDSTVVSQPSGNGFGVRIKGKQHGPIPEWLNAECAKKGITEVWDNRDGLAANPKRPWFKSTSTEDAFWAPRK